MNHRRADVRTRLGGRAPGGTRPPAREQGAFRSAAFILVVCKQRHFRPRVGRALPPSERSVALVPPTKRRRVGPAREPSSCASDSVPHRPRRWAHGISFPKGAGDRQRFGLWPGYIVARVTLIEQTVIRDVLFSIRTCLVSQWCKRQLHNTKRRTSSVGGILPSGARTRAFARCHG